MYDYEYFKNKVDIILNKSGENYSATIFPKKLNCDIIELDENMYATLKQVSVDEANGDSDNDLILEVEFTNTVNNMKSVGKFYCFRLGKKILVDNLMDDENERFYMRCIRDIQYY